MDLSSLSFTERQLNWFWERVDKTPGLGIGDCWEWRGAVNHRGYGALSKRPWGDIRSSHRFSYLLANGKITPGMWILHRCDNPPCCNPAHLYEGTHADNIRDRVERNRSARGESSGMSKLKQHQVDEMRSRYLEGHDKGLTQQMLADDYGVTLEEVSLLIRNRIWRDKNYSPPKHKKAANNPSAQKINQQIADEIRLAVSSGEKTSEQAAKDYGLSVGTIRRIIRNVLWINLDYTYNPKPTKPRTKVTPAIESEVMQLLSSGLHTIEKVAEIVNIGKSTIHRIKKRQAI